MFLILTYKTALGGSKKLSFSGRLLSAGYPVPAAGILFLTAQPYFLRRSTRKIRSCELCAVRVEWKRRDIFTLQYKQSFRLINLIVHVEKSLKTLHIGYITIYGISS